MSVNRTRNAPADPATTAPPRAAAGPTSPVPPTLASAAWISLCAAAVTFILTMVVGATRITHLRRLSRQRH